MPNIASAKKRLRQSLVRRTRNRAAKSALKSQIRKYLETLKSGNLAQAETEFRALTTKFDKAAAANVIHANRAARVKSRLSARLKAVKHKPAAPAAG